MQVRVINLERSTTRRAVVGARLRELEIEHQFFPAVDGAAGQHLIFKKFRSGLGTRYGASLTLGEAGCFASHALLWEQCVESGEPICVLEDDIVLSGEFPRALAQAENLIRSELQFVRLCGLLPRNHIAVRALDEGYSLNRYLKGPSGTQAYVISPDGAARFSNSAMEWAEPVDDYLDRFWFHRVPCLAIRPFRVAQSKQESDVGNRPSLTRGEKSRRRLVRLGDSLQRGIFNATRAK